MGLDLCVWNKCNNRCLMCTNPLKPWPAWDGSFEYDFESIKKRLEKKKEELEKSEILYLSGGEPTLHPQFLEILKYINQNFPKLKIMLLTNGRTFYYDKFSKILPSIKNLSVAISLHGPNAKIHDAITRMPGSFDQAQKGIKNILENRKRGQEVEIRTVVTGKNYKNLGNTLLFLEKEFPSVDRIAIVFLEIEGHAVQNLKSVGASLSDFSLILEKNKKAIISSRKIRLYHFPLCKVPVELWSCVWRTLPKKEVAFVEKCSACSYKKYCLGIHKMYLKYVGKKEIKPMKKKIYLELSKNFHHPIKSISINKKKK